MKSYNLICGKNYSLLFQFWAFFHCPYDYKSISLLERKKIQWAQERDELDNLWAPWENRTSNHWPLSSRGQHTKIATVIGQLQSRRESYSSLRKNSLPPLTQNQTLTKDRYDREGETSGYASDNPIQPGYLPPSHFRSQNTPQSGYESSSSRDDRPRWKNKVMASDWEKNETSASTNEPPNWLKRGLEQDGHIEVTNSSPSESPEQDDIDQDRPFTSGSSSVRSRTYIRGQNIRLDSVELAERERKREIALQHQHAIRAQLEEKERKRSEERRRRIQEEYEEELRIAKEQELERRRHEQEQKLLQEKHEKEEKRKEAMKEAIELAEKEAKLQKMKLKLMKQQKNDINFNNETPTKECKGNNEKNINTKKEKSNLTPRTPTIPKKEENKENLNNTQPLRTDSRTTEINIKNNLEIDHGSKETQNNLNANTKIFPKTSQNQKSEPVTIVIPSNFETLQHFQYAVLMSIPASSSVPVAIPLPVPSDNQQHAVTSTRTENRILTPTQYRQKNKLMCDSSTQTDDLRIEKSSRDKTTNADVVYESRSRKGRNSSRNENVPDRPKWGANRPPTRYLKQSEKDLVYQRKKLRQKNEENLYDDKNSSDESQMGTPRFRKRGHMEKRHPRPLWRKHASEDVFRRDIRMYQSEIIPIEADKNNVCFEHRCCCKCRCSGMHVEAPRVDILTVTHDTPRTTEEPVPTGSQNNNNKMAEALPLLRNEMIDEEQWNSPRPHSPPTNSNNF